MRKNNFFATLALATFAALALSLTACSDSGVMPEDPMGLTQRVETTFDMNGAPMEFNESTLDMMMAARPDPSTGKPVRNPFGDLLKALNLNAEQKVAVTGLLATHKDCVKSALEGLRATEKAIITAARAEAEAIKQQVKDGTLTREDARVQLRDLNKRTKEALKNLPGRLDTRAAVKACDDAFIQGLKDILNPEQLVVLQRWLDSRSGRPPGGRGGGGKPGGRDTTGGGGKPPGGRG